MSFFAAMKPVEHRVEHFTVLVTYTIQLQSLLQSLAASMQTFSDKAVNSERLLEVMRYDTAGVRVDSGRELGSGAAEIVFESIPIKGGGTLTSHCEQGTIQTLCGITQPTRAQLMNYLARINEPPPDTISINGSDIRNYSTTSLRRRIGLIGQECKLMGETIFDCLSYGLGCPEGLDLNTAIQACQAVKIHDGILRIPGAYNARVDRNECALTPEEVRRLVLAAALLRGCQVLVLDGPIPAIGLKSNASIDGVMRMAFREATIVIFE
jgi:ABC-type multidrug transport system fused ATPase/permease subunit